MPWRGDAVPEDDPAVRALRAAGLAVTAPRREVYRVLAGRDRPLSAGEVFDLLRARGSRLGLPSVYRVLQSFAVAGIAHVFLGDEQRFRVCDRSPHAHLVCEECGRVMEHPADTVRRWLAPARHAADFVVNVEHSDVYGLCGRCRRSSSRRPRTDPNVSPNGATRRAALDTGNENGYQSL
jgi:Fur family ferric uptake transcriptional regulator